MADKTSNHLEELSNKQFYEVSDDQPDIRGWYIVDDAAKKIGLVKDLLFDKDEMKVRYLITNLIDGAFEEDRHVLIPIGRARLNKEDERVVLPRVTERQIKRLPTYTKPGELTSDDERSIRDAFAGDGSTTGEYDRKTFYDHEDFNRNAFYGREGNTAE